MDEKKKVIRTGVAIIIVLVVIAAAYYFFIAGKGKKTGPGEQTLQTQKLPGEESAGKEGKSIPAISTELDKSDEVVRKLIAELSSNSAFGQWLKSKNLVRKFVAAVDNIANGQSPRPHMDFFTLNKEFKAILKNGRTYLDPSSYERYNIIADVFDSVSVAGCVRLYEGFKPLFQQAYRELGYPKEDFHQTLLKAIVEICKTPVVDQPIALEKKVTTYVMVDPKLEQLSPAQKHLLRMGPENLQLIQAKLREIALALGFADAQLPKQKTPTR